LVLIDEARPPWKTIDRLLGAPAERRTDFGALHYMHETNTVLVFTREDLGANTIVHELGHAAFDILKRAGIKADPANQEAFTHLAGYMATWVFEKLDVPIRSPR